MDPQIVYEIQARLKELETRERITIPLAIESGSRAWGFPSADSDYDCRFVYVRTVEKTVTLFPVRDVIEEPLTPVFDINGWDLAKALRLMYAGNAVIVEWLKSVFAYQLHEPFRDAALDLADVVCDRRLICKHYYHLAKAQIHRQNFFQGDVSLKKTLYCLRPLAALMWLSHHPERAVAPMNFQDLRQNAGFPDVVSREIDILLERKALSSEMGSERLNPVLSGFILDTFDGFQSFANAGEPCAVHQGRIDDFWRHWSAELSPR
ncbi:hypothetical protein Q669_24955 [Labrenzia sp. C1B10]|nr:hypothetical protein Q669_24955 [Labrenzia sp. C1B10]ERS09086.1 hypothetical protein Q675_16900 [Labrenzia sp. C1B70]